ncbi:MAG: hypothetical protein ACLP9C_13875 [Acidimicrobiales bacterium]
MTNARHLEFSASPEWRRLLEDTFVPRALAKVDLGPNVVEIGPGPRPTRDILASAVEHRMAVEGDVDLARVLGPGGSPVAAEGSTTTGSGPCTSATPTTRSTPTGWQVVRPTPASAPSNVGRLGWPEPLNP